MNGDFVASRYSEMFRDTGLMYRQLPAITGIKKRKNVRHFHLLAFFESFIQRTM